jgi:hypothetical protein
MLFFKGKPCQQALLVSRTTPKKVKKYAFMVHAALVSAVIDGDKGSDWGLTWGLTWAGFWLAFLRDPWGSSALQFLATRRIQWRKM